MLHLEKITKDYVTASETVKALRGVDISFREREFVSILGPSGCGKTTLLNIIGGLDHYTDGDLVINGRSTKSYTDRDWDIYRNHRVGFIFQSYNLIPHQNVLANVELALTIAGIDKEERVARAKAALDKVGLADQYYKKPNQLSGGQCQRVAIARALVNNPEILLADEPTGALDTVTSVQIMDLIREIAGERLVIMVTHNPELAEKYSTRIVKLLDGRVVEDTNPMSVEEEAREDERIAKAAAELLKEEEENSTRVAASGEKIGKKRRKTKKTKEKAKMSFFTAFRLSAKNLLTKKGRTAMVGFAGSIGIFGIAVVLAFSTGIRGYVESMQDDMLSGNPIMIQENTYDLEALTDMMSPADKAAVIKEAGKVYVDQLVKYITEMSKDVDSFMVKNTITQEYIDYVMSMPASNYAAIKLGYSIDLANNLYVDFNRYQDKDGNYGDSELTSITTITNNYTTILKTFPELAKYASYVETLAPSFEQAPNNAEYIESQYQVHGRVATAKNEIMLVLDSDERLSDVLLARLGYYTQAEFESIVWDAVESQNGGTAANSGNYRDYFTYEELMGKRFYWYDNDKVFTTPTYRDPDTNGPGTVTTNAIHGIYNMTSVTENGVTVNKPTFDYHPTMGSTDGALELRVVGILIPNENTSYGCLRSGVYYTEALTEHILSSNFDEEGNAKTEIVKFMQKYGSINSTSLLQSDINGDGVIDALDTMWVGIHYYYDAVIDFDRDGKPDDYYNPADPDNLSNLSKEVTEVLMTPNAVGHSPNLQDLLSTFSKTEEEKEQARASEGALDFTLTANEAQSGVGGILSSLNSMKTLDIRQIGGDPVANSIAIYPVDFESKYLVTEWLDRWNGEGTVGGVAEADRSDIKYTDTLELIIGLINGMIKIVTSALIAFTSISLVVSTVMIGIITYVSVVERIKEIGVIRSIGGRKKDVSHLFNAETFIIGLLAGIIGIGFTLVVSLIGSAVLKYVTGIPGLVQLKLSHALILIALSVGLTLISGLIPARSAANKDPIEALRVQ